MPSTKVGKIQSARYQRTSKGSLVKPAKMSNTSRCLKYIKDEQGDKTLQNDIKKINNDKLAIASKNQKYLIEYAFNKHKCYDNESKTFLRSTNCSSLANSEAEFYADEKAYYTQKIESGNSQRINKAFHIINSFKGHSVPAHKVQQIGEEFARRLVGNSFKYVVSTHTNTDHYHNHIVINAYASDGAYKFRDDWNLGLKLQQISNELSLENGIEIISSKADNNKLELSNKKLTFANIRDSKMYQKGSNKRKIMDDIIITANNSSNWEEYINQIVKKSYKIKQNIKSITYIHDTYGQIRDNRLGQMFTKTQINKYFKEKAELDKISNIKLKVNIKKIYIAKYVGAGNKKIRVPAIIRLVSYIIQIFKEILSQIPSESFTKNNINQIDIIKQIKTLETIKELLKKYNVNNSDSLKIEKNKLLREYVKYRNRQKEFIRVLKKCKEIEIAINNYNNIKDDIHKKYKLSEEQLNLYNYTQTDILENRASLNPMSPKTKSRLYKALYNSGYVLKYKYKQLSESDAKNIIYFLGRSATSTDKNTDILGRPATSTDKSTDILGRSATNIDTNADILGRSATSTDKNTDILGRPATSTDKNIDILGRPATNKPNTLYTVNEYIKLKEKNQLPVYEKTPLENRFKNIDFKQINQNLTKSDEYLINLYRNSILKLRAYGLNTDNEISDFKENFIDTIRNNSSLISKMLDNLKSDLNDLTKIESFYDGTYNQTYKSLKMLDDYDNIEKEINTMIAQNNSNTELLICLNNSLKSIDLSVLDDNDIIIAPMDILITAKLILYIRGNSLDDNEIFKYSKSDIKKIITDFQNEYNIDKLLENELKVEEHSEMIKAKKEGKNNTQPETKNYKDDNFKE